MRISDWSSDVCSSDLAGEILAELVGRALQAAEEAVAPACAGFSHCCASCAISAPFSRPVMVAWMMEEGVCGAPKRTGAKFSAWPESPVRSNSTDWVEPMRSEERRGGKECGRSCRYRWGPYP